MGLDQFFSSIKSCQKYFFDLILLDYKYTKKLPKKSTKQGFIVKKSNKT